MSDTYETNTKRAASISEARHRLGGVSRSTIYKLISEGRLRRVKIGRRTAITDESINALATGDSV
jgi:excisionase family DNA binding protein